MAVALLLVLGVALVILVNSNGSEQPFEVATGLEMPLAQQPVKIEKPPDPKLDRRDERSRPAPTPPPTTPERKPPEKRAERPREVKPPEVKPPEVPPEAPVLSVPTKYPKIEPGKLVHGEYHLNKIKGFSVYLNRTVFEENGKADGYPLDVLQSELDRLSQLSPQLVKAMRTVKVFVEWDHTVPEHAGAIAVFYGGGGEWLRFQGVTPQKAGHITMLSLKRITTLKLRQTDKLRGVVLLHEMAHAAHHYDLMDDNPIVRNAYEQAITRGLYRAVPDGKGKKVRAYASTSEHEYFAEITCAYLDYCDYFPHNREELREYDSVGFELMRKVWGDPKSLKTK